MRGVSDEGIPTSEADAAFTRHAHPTDRRASGQMFVYDDDDDDQSFDFKDNFNDHPDEHHDHMEHYPAERRGSQMSGHSQAASRRESYVSHQSHPASRRGSYMTHHDDHDDHDGHNDHHSEHSGYHDDHHDNHYDHDMHHDEYGDHDQDGMYHDEIFHDDQEAYDGMMMQDEDQGDTYKPTLFKSHEGEHFGDHTGIGAPLSKNVYIFAFCAALNSCNLGYDIGVNTDAGVLLQEAMDLSDTQIEIFMGSLNLFAMAGALSAHLISDNYGRRGAFMISALVFIVGVVIMSISNNFMSLMFGRVFVGLGVGFGLAIDPIYISEIAPAAHRGRLVTWSEIATNVGIVFGFSSGLVFAKYEADTAWRCMFGMGILIPCIMIILLWTVMPESPRWLVQQERDADAARVLQRIYGKDYDVVSLVNSMKLSIIKDQEAERATGWYLILFPTRAYKRMLLVGLGIAVAQQLIGIDAIQYFLLYIIKEAGIKSRSGQIWVLISLGLVKLTLIITAGKIFDRKGRRPMIFMSLGGCAFALLLLSFNFYGDSHSPGFAIFALGLYLAFFSVGMGPAAWLIPSEVFATSIRAKGMSLATFLNRVTATLMSSTFLTVAHGLSWSGYFLMMSFFCLLVMVYMVIYLPETKGRSLEDMTVYFAEITGDRSILSIEMAHMGEGITQADGSPFGNVDDTMVHASGMMA